MDKHSSLLFRSENGSKKFYNIGQSFNIRPWQVFDLIESGANAKGLFKT
jgi:hypothetical protein